MCNVNLKKKLLAVHRGIINRCYNPKFRSYKFYGAKGVTMCDEWRQSSRAFVKWALENGYEFIPSENGRNLISIDRINTNLGYTPENCRWVKQKTQTYNKSSVKLYEYNGELKTLPDWCKELNLEDATVRRRMRIDKLSFEDAIKKDKFFISEKYPKSKYHYIYSDKNGYSIQFKRIYIGHTNNLEDAILIRDNKLIELGMTDILNKIRNLEYGNKNESNND